MAALAQSQAAAGASSDSLLQDLVSLSPAALGQPSTVRQSYNAQGLQQQLHSNTLLNDRLLQSDAAGASAGNGDPLLQSLLPAIQTPAAANAQTQASAAAGTNGTNPNWAQLIAQDSSLANEFVESQAQQGVLSILG